MQLVSMESEGCARRVFLQRVAEWQSIVSPA
jgi:hypothetical protein